MADWRKALLSRMGLPVTKQNLQFLTSWQRWEGGHTNNDASFNYLNTTRDGPGAVKDINSVGVTAFDNFQHGIGATAATLNSGRYDDVIKALQSGNPYKAKPVAGLSTWLSGKPDSSAGHKYAAKVLGLKPEDLSLNDNASNSLNSSKKGGFSPAGQDYRRALASSLMAQNEAIARGELPGMDGIVQLAQLRRQAQDTHKLFGPETQGGPVVEPSRRGGVVNPGTNWKGTHVTDGLGWGTKTAQDIMGKPGTPVAAPVDGVVKYFKPTGAQGGGSMLIQGADGREYWLGHIAAGMKAGTRVKAGQVVAQISADHANPHLHIDRR